MTIDGQITVAAIKRSREKRFDFLHIEINDTDSTKQEEDIKGVLCSTMLMEDKL